MMKCNRIRRYHGRELPLVTPKGPFDWIRELFQRVSQELSGQIDRVIQQRRSIYVVVVVVIDGVNGSQGKNEIGDLTDSEDLKATCNALIFFIFFLRFFVQRRIQSHSFDDYRCGFCYIF